MAIYIFSAIFVALILGGFILSSRRKTGIKFRNFNEEWKAILLEKVIFYRSLENSDRIHFEQRILHFLNTTRITGINTEVEDTDRLLIASSAIIPIFAFTDWEYHDLDEVLLYPESFDENFQTENPSSNILGMVGSGFMEGKMLLSKKSLRFGFHNETDKKNTAIHEFIHLIDKSDGVMDGIPGTLIEKQYTLPWLDLMRQKMNEIYQQSSDINPYGGTNKKEFFAVIGEYFFERPDLLTIKHPEIYKMMKKIFHQPLHQKLLGRTRKQTNRNDPCPCGSGKKFKHCCGSIHYKGN